MVSEQKLSIDRWLLDVRYTTLGNFILGKPIPLSTPNFALGFPLSRHLSSTHCTTIVCKWNLLDLFTTVPAALHIFIIKIVHEVQKENKEKSAKKCN